jgi:hypothetical protein
VLSLKASGCAHRFHHVSLRSGQPKMLGKKEGATTNRGVSPMDRCHSGRRGVVRPCRTIR